MPLAPASLIARGLGILLGLRPKGLAAVALLVLVAVSCPVPSCVGQATSDMLPAVLPPVTRPGEGPGEGERGILLPCLLTDLPRVGDCSSLVKGAGAQAAAGLRASPWSEPVALTRGERP
jgi:hypothetical protein